MKTAHDNILEGYARHRVLNAATALGYQVEKGPVALSEAPLWKEVFLTSSIRLCQPVDSIVISVDNDAAKTGFLWARDTTERDPSIPVWQRIYNRILEEEEL